MHFDFLSTIKEISRGGWGKDFATSKDAQQSIAKASESAADWASLLLIRGVLGFVDAIGQTPDATEKKPPIEDIPNNAINDTTLKAGDLLWIYDGDDGLYQPDAVLYVDDSGHALVCNTSPHFRHRPRWLTHSPHKTPVDAMRAQAQSDIEYYLPRLDFARRVLAACESGDQKELRLLEGGMDSLEN